MDVSGNVIAGKKAAPDGVIGGLAVIEAHGVSTRHARSANDDHSQNSAGHQPRAARMKMSHRDLQSRDAFAKRTNGSGCVLRETPCEKFARCRRCMDAAGKTTHHEGVTCIRW
jgi:hypothetical protein